MSRVYYNLDLIYKIKASFNIIFGERSNGKSYQLKHKRAVENYLKSGNRFILLRRFLEEISNDKIERYFADVDVAKLTNNKYNVITCYRKEIYLSKYDFEKGKTVRGEKIGYAVALSTEQNYAGASYLDVSDIIFEEFMSRSVYLPNEPTKLMNFYCTVDRKRATTKLWLCGNSISRICPYIEEWGLRDVFRTIKQGEIKTVDIPTGEYVDGILEYVKIAIEYCRSSGSSSHTIGYNAKMMNSGEWESSPQPHLPKSLKEYNILYKIGFQFSGFKFLGLYLKNKQNNEYCWFIHDYNKEFKDNIMVVSDQIKESKRWITNIYNIPFATLKFQNFINESFRECSIFYSTDLCGTDFKHAINFEIKR